MTDVSGALIQDADEGRVYALLGNRVIIKLAGRDTGGAYAAVIYTAGPHFSGTPLHRHPFSEWFHLLSGRLVLHLGDETNTIAAGQSVFVPGGFPHTFENPHDEPATFQLLISPAGFEEYFAELIKLAQNGKHREPEEIAALHQRYGVEPVITQH